MDSRLGQQVMDLLRRSEGELRSTDSSLCDTLGLNDYDPLHFVLARLRDQGLIGWYREGDGRRNDLWLLSDERENALETRTTFATPDRAPPGYRPPVSTGDLLRRYQSGERYFKEASLKGADLRGAHLEYAEFGGADFTDADLSDAHLKNARFYEADLQRTLFSGADLRWAYLSEADATDADFSNADLSRSRLSVTCLKNANLSNAALQYCRVTAGTYRRSEWTPQYLALLTKEDLEVVNLHEFPPRCPGCRTWCR